MTFVCRGILQDILLQPGSQQDGGLHHATWDCSTDASGLWNAASLDVGSSSGSSSGGNVPDAHGHSSGASHRSRQTAGSSSSGASTLGDVPTVLLGDVFMTCNHLTGLGLRPVSACNCPQHLPRALSTTSHAKFANGCSAWGALQSEMELEDLLGLQAMPSPISFLSQPRSQRRSSGRSWLTGSSALQDAEVSLGSCLVTCAYYICCYSAQGMLLDC